MVPVDPYQQLPPTTNVSSQIDQEFSQINKQMEDLSLQYQNPTYEYGNLSVESPAGPLAEVTGYNVDSTINQYKQQVPIAYEAHQSSDFYGQQRQPEFSGNTNAGYGPEQQQSPQMYQPTLYNEHLSYGESEFGLNEVNFTLFSFPSLNQY